MTEPTLQGFDVSHFQPTLTPNGVRHLIDADGYSFGGIKMSEGDYQTDSHFAANRDACRANSLPRFVYHEATAQQSSQQLYRILQASGGHLYPRERIALVLGDFSVPPAQALELAALVAAHGPTKTRDGKTWRPAPVLYANRSNFEGVYFGPNFAPYSKWVAAFPGNGDEFKIPNAVCHQDSDHDPATHGDHDVWRPGTTPAQLVAFFRS
jgi:hypothetical protein